MSNAFSKVADRFKDSPVAIPIALACILGLAISIAATISDYLSSYEGYANLPTEKVWGVIWLIAMLPQVGQIVFGSWFILSFEKIGNRVKANWWYAIITFLLFLFDNGTDIWFKTKAFTHPVYVWFIAAIEALVVYTVGSEMLLIASFGLFIYMLPIAIEQLGLIGAKLAGTDDSSGSSRNVR